MVFFCKTRAIDATPFLEQHSSLIKDERSQPNNPDSSSSPTNLPQSNQTAATTMVPIPSPQDQEDITSKLAALATTLEAHEAWTPPRPHPSLLQIWDFVKRSHYIMTEIDNIRHGRPLQYPDQIPTNEEGELFPTLF